MSEARGLFKNTLAMLLATIVRMSSSLILSMLVARKLGLTGMGEFSLVLTLFWIFQTIASMGIQPLIVREVAQDKDRTGLILINAGLLAIIASLLMSVIMVAFAYIANYSESIRLSTYWMSVSLILYTIGLVLQSVFIAWEKAELVLGGMTLENFIRLAVGVAVLILGGTVVELSMVFALTSMISLIVYIYLTHRYITCLHFKIDIQICKWIFKMVPAFAGISIFNTIYNQANVILISKLASIEEVALYTAPVRIAGMVQLIVQSYKVAIQPVSARMFMKSREAFRDLCVTSMKYILILTIPVCMGVMVLAPDILQLVFGEEYISSSPIFRVLIWTLFPYGIGLVLAIFLIASNNQKVDLRINFICMLIMLTLGVFIIKKFGAIGAAWVKLGTATLFVLLQIQFIFKKLFRINFIKLFWKIFLAAAGMAMLAFAVNPYVHVMITIFLCILFYFGLLTLLGSFSITDIQYIMKLKRAASK